MKKHDLAPLRAQGKRRRQSIRSSPRPWPRFDTRTSWRQCAKETGVIYNKQRLHNAGYFRKLLATNPTMDEGLCSLLRLCRETVVRLGKTESALVPSLERDSQGAKSADVENILC
jgi:hypothetical protein